MPGEGATIVAATHGNGVEDIAETGGAAGGVVSDPRSVKEYLEE